MQHLLNRLAACITLGSLITALESHAAGTQVFSVECGARFGSIWKFRQAERLPYKLRLMTMGLGRRVAGVRDRGRVR